MAVFAPCCSWLMKPAHTAISPTLPQSLTGTLGVVSLSIRYVPLQDDRARQPQVEGAAGGAHRRAGAPFRAEGLPRSAGEAGATNPRGQRLACGWAYLTQQSGRRCCCAALFTTLLEPPEAALTCPLLHCRPHRRSVPGRGLVRPGQLADAVRGLPRGECVQPTLKQTVPSGSGHKSPIGPALHDVFRVTSSDLITTCCSKFVSSIRLGSGRCHASHGGIQL